MMISNRNAKTMNDLLMINHYDEVKQCFVMNDGTFFDILKIRTQDLKNSDSDKIEYACYILLKWLKTYPYEPEIIGMNFPVDTTEQQIYFEHVMERTENPQYIHYLKQKLLELKTIDQKMIEKQFYLLLFFETEKDLFLYREKTLIQLGKASLIEEIPQFYKELICYRINNKCCRVPKERIRQHNIQGNVLHPKEEKKKKDVGYDVELMERIGVVGNISFPSDDRYIKTGMGYEACVYIYDYPEKIDMHWLIQLFNIDHAITSIHLSPKNKREVKKNINKALGEKESRIDMASKATELRDAKQDYMDTLKLYEEVQSLGEIIFHTCIRLYISAATLSELDLLVSTTIDELDSDQFKACVFLNEQEADWKAIYMPYSKQQLSPLTAKKGKPFTSTTLAFGNPFHFSSLMDPTAGYFGLTCSTAGTVMWDPFLRTNNRNYYNMVAWGEMRAGKSTLLKKMFKNCAIRGDFIRGFDVSGEWVDLVNDLGGKIIALDGSAGRINDLEVLRTAEDEMTSYRQHIGKLTTTYRFLKPSATDDEVFEYANLLSNLYIKKGLLDEVGRPIGGKITGLSHELYPTYSELLEYTNKIIEDTNYEGLSDAKRQDLAATIDEYIKIKRVINNLINNYGEIFDGPTTIESILDEQIVFYDIRGLVKMSPEIYDAVMYKAFSLNYDNCVQIGSVMKQKWEQWEAGDHENGLHLYDVTHFVIIMDEFHRSINAHKLMAVEQISTFEREAPKFFGGIWFASQSVNDSFPENAEKDGIEQIKRIFELCQYKVIMRQDSANIPKLKDLFRGEIPEQELEQVPKFETGQCILNIKSDTNILMKIFITDEEKQMFKGGA